MGGNEALAYSRKTLHLSPDPSNSGDGQTPPPTSYNPKQGKTESFSNLP